MIHDVTGQEVVSDRITITPLAEGEVSDLARTHHHRVGALQVGALYEVRVATQGYKEQRRIVLGLPEDPVARLDFGRRDGDCEQPATAFGLLKDPAQP